MKFKLQAFEDDPSSAVITHEFDEIFTESVVERLDIFMRAAGFCFVGKLEIVEPEEQTIVTTGLQPLPEVVTTDESIETKE